jgi:transposase
MGTDRSADAEARTQRSVARDRISRSDQRGTRSGCGWRMLPVDFGHWRTVYGWFRDLALRFLF